MYYFIKCLSLILCKLPFRIVDSAATILSTVLYLFMASQRFTARMNLTLLYPDKSNRQISSIIKKNFKEIVLTFMEVLRLPILNTDIQSDSFKHINEDYFKEACQEESVIFVGCHSGNWESVNVGTPSVMKYMVIVKRQKNAGLNRFLTEIRQKSGAVIVFDDDLRSITKYLKKNYSIAIMYDHGFKNSPMFTKFCGMTVQIPKSVFTLAKKYNRKLFPVFFGREGNVNTIKYFKPHAINDTNIDYVAQLMTDDFEKELRDNPYSYLWSYKRFKRSESKRVLVLSDSKPGHVNQSISLSNIIEEEFKNSKTRVIELKLSRFTRTLCDIIVLLNIDKLFKKNSLLAQLLFKNKFDDLFRYTDLTISAGSSLSSANRIISSAVNSKSSVIMKPNVKASAFDRVLLPAHDIKDHDLCPDNVIQIAGALKFVNKQQISEDNNDFINKFSIEEASKYATILIGGPIKTNNLDKTKIKQEIVDLKDFIKEKGYQIMISTSRRTPQWLESFIDKEFKDESVNIIANKENFSYAINALLNLADFTVSTADSISMVTEAATFKPTLIIDLFDTLKVSTKHRVNIESLTLANQIVLIDRACEDFRQSLDCAFSSKENLTVLDNCRLVRDGIKGLF